MFVLFCKKTCFFYKYMIFVKKMYICKKNIMHKGRNKIQVDNEMLSRIVIIYKEFFNISSEIETKNLSKTDKMVLSFHLSHLQNVSTESIAELFCYSNHSAICYHRKKIFQFLGKKSSIRAKDFEVKFITFNAYFNRNKKSFIFA